MSIQHIRTCDRCPSAPVIEEVTADAENQSDDLVITRNGVEVGRLADICTRCGARVDSLIDAIMLRKDTPDPTDEKPRPAPKPPKEPEVKPEPPDDPNDEPADDGGEDSPI